ncbi:hypothetical protein F4819DRAFT_498029 [Hypoxylon fuscum]|nr:hypothetical protein F4819DRAFT_498029 [Hypoxylon fuscum]
MSSLDDVHLLPLAEQEIILNGPALTPPSGVIPNLENPPNSNTLAIAVITLCLCIWTTAFALATYSRLRCMKNLHIEDSSVLSLGAAWALYRVAMGVGYFVHQWDVRVKDLSNILYPFHVGSELYAVIIMLYKTAILLEWVRIFVPRNTRGPLYWTCHTLLWINVLFYSSVLIAGNISCTPFAKLWDKTLPGTCRNREAIDVATASFNLVSHLLILLIAQMNIWKLHLQTKKKIGVALIFALGILACISAGFRLSASIKFLDIDDATYAIASVSLWCCTEIMCIILIFCMPNIPKAFRLWAPAIVAAFSSLFCMNEAKDDICIVPHDSDSRTMVLDNTHRLVIENGMLVRQSNYPSTQDFTLATYPREFKDIPRPQAAILRTTEFTATEEHGGGNEILDDRHFQFMWDQRHV